MSRWALYVAAAFSVAGCTRPNGAFDDGQGDTDTPTRGSDTSTTSSGTTGDPTLGTTQGSNSTTVASSMTDPPLPTEDPTEPETETGSGSSTGGELCFTVFDADAGCDLYSPTSCRDGDCRPYGDEEGLTDIGCVGQPPAAERLDLGVLCTHECGGLLGADGCPPGSTCDPFADPPTCVEFCDPEEDAFCAGDTSCFEHFAGEKPFGLCRADCNPLPNDCPGGQNCVPQVDGPATCVDPGDARPGQVCDNIADCGLNFACVPGLDPDCAGSACCVELCSVLLNDCTAGSTCLDLGRGVLGGCVLDG